MNNLQKIQPLLFLPSVAVRGIHVTAVVSKKHIRAGIYKVSKHQNVELTYEEAKAPHFIGVQKSWLTWNTTNLHDEGRQAETLSEDAFIRKFIAGTWPSKFASEVVIKRRFNTVVIAGLTIIPIDLREFNFLVGYSEEMLSLLLKCPVKLELQTVMDKKDTIFKYK